jgi:hypothetical protein
MPGRDSAFWCRGVADCLRKYGNWKAVLLRKPSLEPVDLRPQYV